MADQLPTNNNPSMLGGVNLKSSEYSLTKKEFLNLRNVDFDVPNALSKRPGSTQTIGANTSGPILALHEFVRLDGASTVIAASDTALFYANGASLNPLDTGWSNGQPPDMLTFVNKAWMANGAKFYGWSGVGATPLPVGLPIQSKNYLRLAEQGNSAIAFSIFGVTMGTYSGATVGARVELFAAMAYVRSDGYQGPVFIPNATNCGPNQLNSFSSGSFWRTPGGVGDYGNNATLPLDVLPFLGGLTGIGFTAPPGYGISNVALYFLVDSGTGLTLSNSTAVIKNGFYGGAILNRNVDPTSFKFFTLVPLDGSSQIFIYGASNWLFSGPAAFSLMTFGWFDTNTPKYIEINQNSFFSSGFSQSPSNVWFSELGSPEAYQPENFFEVRTNDGDRVYALKAYNNQMMVLKQNSFHKVIGDSPDTFELIELSGEYGCISNQTVVEYQEKLVWLDQKGIVQYNGASWDIISTPVEDIFRRMNLNSAKEKACAVHHLYRNQIWFGIPIDGATQNNITVVYDYLVNAWTFFDGFNPASFGFVKASDTKPTVWRGDYSGMIYKHGESFLGDNGTAITCIWTPHWDKNKENETWIWRRSFLDVGTASGLTGQITAKVFSNYDLNTVQGTFAMYQDAFQSRAEMGVVGKAVTAEFAHRSASLPLLVNNYSWAKRFLRNV